MKNTLWPLERVLCIYHLLCFQKDLRKTKALIDLDSKVNVMILAYTVELGLKIRKTDIGAQKIDGSIFDIFRMVLTNFHVKNKLDKTWFFQKTFLIANTTLEVMLGMLFLKFNNADVQFIEQELIQKSYTTAEAL